MTTAAFTFRTMEANPALQVLEASPLSKTPSYFETPPSASNQAGHPNLSFLFNRDVRVHAAEAIIIPSSLRSPRNVSVVDSMHQVCLPCSRAIWPTSEFNPSLRQSPSSLLDEMARTLADTGMHIKCT